MLIVTSTFLISAGLHAAFMTHTLSQATVSRESLAVLLVQVRDLCSNELKARQEV